MDSAAQAAPQRAADGEERQRPRNYFELAIPDPFRILGLQLKPLSIGRYRLLKRFDVAFVADREVSAEAGDLLLGVLISSMRCDEFIEFSEAPHFQKEVRRWSRRICPKPWIGRIPFVGAYWRRKHSFDMFEKMALFRRYINEGSEVPKYWDESPGGAPSGAHWAHSIEVILRSEVGWSQDEVNEQPLTKALADYFKHMENKGLIRLMSPDELAVPDLTKEQIAAFEQMAKAQEAVCPV